MKCHICNDEWPDTEGGLESAVDHIRNLHPEEFEPPERWPDGGLVIEDADPQPEDFIDETRP